MAQIYRPESGSKVRKKLMRRMASAINYAGADDISSKEQLDLLAYLQACLIEINKTVNQTVAAWEKRGYWVKADRFHMDWRWVEQAIDKLSTALHDQDVSAAASAIASVAANLGDSKPYKKDMAAKPWQGSWERSV